MQLESDARRFTSTPRSSGCCASEASDRVVFANIAGELTTDRNVADVIFDKIGETVTRHGYVPLYYRTSRRLLALKFADSGARLYDLRLPAREHAEDCPNLGVVVAR